MVPYKRLLHFVKTPRADGQRQGQPVDVDARLNPHIKPGLAARLKEAMGPQFEEVLAPSEARTSEDR